MKEREDGDEEDGVEEACETVGKWGLATREASERMGRWQGGKDLPKHQLHIRPLLIHHPYF